MKRAYKSPERAAAAAARAAMMLARRFVSIEVAAEIVGQARPTVYEWAHDGELRRETIGKFLYVSLDDLAKKAPGAFGKRDPVAVAKQFLKTNRAARAA